MKNFGLYEKNRKEREKRFHLFSVATTITLILGALFTGSYEEGLKLPDNLTVASNPSQFNSESVFEQLQVIPPTSIDYSQGVPGIINPEGLN